MKILHISGAKGWGGNEQQIIYILPELQQNGVENVVFGIADSVLQKECSLLNIQFITAKKEKLNKFANYKYLKTIVQQIKPDLIHLHTSDSLTVFTISDIIFGLKTKAVFSKKGMGTSSSFLSKFKYNYKGINSIICVSKSVQNDMGAILSAKNRAKTTVIHDCVSLAIQNESPTLSIREKYAISSEIKLVGNIGNHAKAKDLTTLINTVDVVINELNRKDILFVQIGEFSKLTPVLMELVKSKKLEKNILFLDKLEKASSVVNQFDLFLMTSEREGGPTSVLEAMLIGVPVVSTQVGVIQEVIIPGESGFYAPVKEPKQLAAKVIELLDDEMLQEKCSKNAKYLIENEFNSEVIAQKTVTLYKQIIES
jgi:glycosyltransferase involved in cell wall biosynthesis